MSQRYLAGRGVNRLIQRQLQREPKNIPLAVIGNTLPHFVVDKYHT